MKEITPSELAEKNCTRIFSILQMSISDTQPLNLQQQICKAQLVHVIYFIILDYDSYCNFIILEWIYNKCVDIYILIITFTELSSLKNIFNY